MLDHNIKQSPLKGMLGMGGGIHGNFGNSLPPFGEYGPFDFFGDGSALAQWKFDGNATDVSGNYNGTASNISYVTGHFTQAADFNGTNSTVSIPSVKNSYPFSVSMWVTSDLLFNGGTNDGMDELFNLNINGQRVSLGFVNSSGSNWPVGVTVMYGGTSHFSTHSTSTILSGATTSDWFHIVYSIVGSVNESHRVYINGCQCGLVNVGGGHGGSAGWNIGSNSTGSEYWNGKIDNVRFFNKAITSDEAWQLFQEYQTQTEVVKNNLKIWYDFSNTNCYSGSGSTVNNIAPGISGYNGTVVGAVFGGTNQSKYFDFEVNNSNDKITTSTSISTSFNNKELTMECWAFHESVNSNVLHAMISCQNDAGANEGASICTDGRSSTHGGGTAPVYHYQLGQNGSWGTRWTTDGSFGNTGSNTADPGVRWDHCVGVFDGKRKFFYENGVLIGDEGEWQLLFNESIRYAGGSTWTIGAQPEGGSYNRYYDGKIAIVRIYDIALSPAQVLHNYNKERSRFGV